ncbi:MAG: UDP-3-O-acyl-N-acetylglucosamine deacetylase [Oscillatoriales cyanobacterium]|nr:MAG: UDP-3-O-acyl-N-acetylglucosamine deacetylase [Oscillatoriales cyanobacterium]
MYTLQTAFERSGVGLHSGQVVRVRVAPQLVGDRGIYFQRSDLPDRPEIPARWDCVSQTLLSTEVRSPADPTATVRTIEHLMAALIAQGITAADIELDGPEIPLLDGSARGWCEAIAQAGCQPLTQGRSVAPVTEPIWVRDGDAFVAALPSEELRFSYGIDFELAAIGNQWHSWSPGSDFSPNPSQPGSFAAEIAPARTFGLAPQIEQLQAAGLIRGGSLENALVCGETGWLNPPLRYENEPARHKILDLVGDLSLLGAIPRAHYLAYKASHRLHGQLVTLLAAPAVSPLPAAMSVGA